MSVPVFPPALDNTMVSTFRACPRKFWWRHVQLLQKGETSIHLISGGAFAKGLEVVRKEYFDKGKPLDEALPIGAAALLAAYGNVEPHPIYSNKSAPNMLGALAYYFETWPIDRIIRPYRPSAGAKHTIEWNFTLPIPGCYHPETGQQLLYCGRFDFVGEHENGMRVGEDDKTTSQLGNAWFQRWRLPNQILGYMWGAREHGMNLAGFNIRGIGLLKNSYSHAETLLMINDWQIDRFLVNLIATVTRMVDAYQESKLQGHIDGGSRPEPFELDLSATCSAYGGCDYLMLCESLNPQAFIEPNFVIHEWNPLASRD